MIWTTIALWAALALAGLATGALASQRGTLGVASRIEGVLLAAAAAGVIAWFANAGGLLAASTSNALLTAYVPIDAPAGYRLAVLWSTLPGAALTIATGLLVCAVLLPISGTHRHRVVLALTAFAFLGLVLSVWFAPVTGNSANSIAAFLQSPFAAVAPLFALVSLMALAVVISIVAARHGVSHWWTLVSWIASTGAVAAEQVARTQLGIGPRDGVVLGNASSGLVLWLITSALLHRRVRSLLGVRSPDANRAAGIAAHAGALLLILSFAAHALAKRSTVSLGSGQSSSLSDSFGRQWQLANQGISRFDTDGADVIAAALDVRNPQNGSTLLSPEIREYHRADGTHLENAVVLRRSTGLRLMAMRVLLIDADSLDVAQVRVTFLPVPFLSVAGIALLFGSLAMRAIVANKPRRAPE